MKWTETPTPYPYQKSEIIALWNREYPVKLALADVAAFDTYLASLEDKGHLLLTDEDGRIKGWLLCFIRDKERCFVMALDASVQGQGWGSALIKWARNRYPSLNGWVIDSDGEPKQNGHLYKSPIAFYRKNGFEILQDEKLTKNGIKGIKIRWSQ